MKRNLHYMEKTLKELLEMYAYENGRENQKDAEITQKIIVNEVYERINKVLECLIITKMLILKAFTQN